MSRDEQAAATTESRRHVKLLGAILTALRLFPHRDNPLIRETIRGYITRGKEARERNSTTPSREEQLEAAILRIYRTQVYEEPGNRDRGLNVEFVGAINDAVYLVETGETQRHDFGMLDICVRCGADECEVNERIARFTERKAKLTIHEGDFDDLN